MRIAIGMLASFALVATSGCATVTRGRTEGFGIISNPPGATATLSTGQVCLTPCSIPVKRKGDITVTFDKEGYQQMVVTVGNKLSGGGAAAGVLGNAVLGGLIGLGVDGITGAGMDREPNPLRVDLVPIDSDQSPEAP